MSSFSQRFGFSGPAKEISVWEDAPESLRVTVLETARSLDYGPSDLRKALCTVLRKRPDPNNWTEYPNVWDEVQSLMYECDWFKVYDVIELIAKDISDQERVFLKKERSERFKKAINQCFLEEGIGWQLVDGTVLARSDEGFERSKKIAASELKSSGRSTTANEIQEALLALSRRPKPNFRGAVFHGMGALECIIRDLAGNNKLTLGEALRKHPGIVPSPVDEALVKLWGYASNEARHVAEGQEPNRDDAELIVGLAITLATYLNRKNPTREVEW